MNIIRKKNLRLCKGREGTVLEIKICLFINSALFPERIISS